MEYAARIVFSSGVVYLEVGFHNFCCFRGRKPTCCLALCDSGLGVCVSRHVALMHVLKVLIISWNFLDVFPFCSIKVWGV